MIIVAKGTQKITFFSFRKTVKKPPWSSFWGFYAVVFNKFFRSVLFDSSFPVIHKISIFALINFENNLDAVISFITVCNLNSMHHYKFKFAKSLFNLFITIESYTKMQMLPFVCIMGKT